MTAGMWPEFQAIIEKDRASGHRALEELPVARTREVMAAALVRWGGPGPEMASVTERLVSSSHGDVPVTIYAPVVSANPLPAVLYVHGGGFVLGSVRTHDALGRHLAVAGSVLVVSVEYARAPESPFPVQAAQCAAVASWMRDNIRGLGGDPDRMAIAGDSAGATIAASVCLLMRALGEPPLAVQCLLYPPLASACDTRSWRRLGTDHFLNRSTMRWFWDNYLQDRRGALSEPLLVADLAGLPSALLVLPGLDPAADEGAAYAKRLQEAGVDVQTIHRPGAIHGYLGMAGISPQARRDLLSVGGLLGDLLRRPSLTAPTQDRADG
jgi:acetyl esterase